MVAWEALRLAEGMEKQVQEDLRPEGRLTACQRGWE